MATIAEFSFTYSRDELRAAAWTIFWRAYGRWVLLFAVVIFVLGLALCVPVATRGTGAQLAVFAVIYALLIAGWFYLRGGRSTPFNTGEIRVVADDDRGLHVTGPVFEQTVAWTAFQRIGADERFLYLFLNRSRAQVFPRRVGPAVEALRDWFERRGLLTTS